MASLRHLLCLTFLALLGCASCTPSGYSASNLAAYSNYTMLTDEYEVYWAGNDTWIHLAFVVETLGWFGFGLAEPTSGSMGGADILVAWINDNDGTVSIQDRWAPGKQTPELDLCPSNWVLDDGFSNATHTVIAVSRLRNTSDNSDRVFTNGPVKVIWAMSPNGADGLGYHGSMRHATSIEFFHDAAIDDRIKVNSTWEYTDLLVNNFTVPTESTVYACQSFDLTQSVDKHIVRIEPILNPTTSGMIHHFLLHQCTNGTLWQQYQTPGRCSSPINPTDQGCISPIFGWGIGGGPLYLPDEAGYHLGTATDSHMKFFILEVHYNSPDPTQPTFRRDQSGVRVWYTSELRQYDAGMLVLGDPFVTSAPIPPHQRTHIQATCNSACTALWPHPINIFADFLHMHEIGARIWSTVHRDGVQLPGFMNRIEFYDFDFQDLFPITPYQVLPGDRIETHCVYNSYPRNNNTTFGPASTNEMCMEFVAYYPLLNDSATGKPWSVCGYADKTQLTGSSVDLGNVSVCGSLDFLELVTRASLLPYSLTLDLPGGEIATFGSSNSNGMCMDALSGVYYPAPPPPSPVPIDGGLSAPDAKFYIMVGVIGGSFVLVVIGGLILQAYRSKVALRPKKLKL